MVFCKLIRISDCLPILILLKNSRKLENPHLPVCWSLNAIKNESKLTYT